MDLRKIALRILELIKDQSKESSEIQQYIISLKEHKLNSVIIYDILNICLKLAAQESEFLENQVMYYLDWWYFNCEKPSTDEI